MTALRTSQDMLGERGIWRCSCCGEPLDAGPHWRWAGDHWQHHHDYPVGHMPAKYFPFQDDIARLRDLVRRLRDVVEARAPMTGHVEALLAEADEELKR